MLFVADQDRVVLSIFFLFFFFAKNFISADQDRVSELKVEAMTRLKSDILDFPAPTDPLGGDIRAYGDNLCAHTVATYPKGTCGYQIICDWFHVR